MPNKTNTGLLAPLISFWALAEPCTHDHHLDTLRQTQNHALVRKIDRVQKKSADHVRYSRLALLKERDQACWSPHAPETALKWLKTTPPPSTA
ncbi:MAG: hypothetical protein EB015_11820 [Methylocystaceae bacterium]|nr:hypothetical protein [Methylocystaceae bacterium]